MHVLRIMLSPNPPRRPPCIYAIPPPLLLLPLLLDLLSVKLTQQLTCLCKDSMFRVVVSLHSTLTL